MIAKQIHLLTIMFLSLMLFSACGSVHTVGVSEGNRQETFKEFELKTGYLDRNETAPAWMTPFKSPAIEFMYTLPKGKILVGIGRQKDRSYNLLHGPIVMYRTSDGTEMWRYQREESIKVEYAFLTYTPEIIFLRKENNTTTFFALNPETGQEQWQVQTTGEMAFEFSMDHNLLVVASKGAKGTALKAFDIKTGNPRWNGLSPVLCNKQVPQLYILHDRLWVIGNGTSMHDIASGRIDWNNPGIGPVASRGYPLATADGIFLGTQYARFYRLKKNGGVIWKLPLSNSPGAFTIHKGKVYISHEDHRNDKYKMTAVNYTDGKVIWKKDFKKKLRSRIVTRGHRIYLVIGNDLVALSASRGNELARITLPVWNWRAADRMVPFEDHLVVVQEASIGAYQWDSLNPIWVHKIRSAEPNFKELYQEMIEHHWPDETIWSVQDQVCSPVIFAQTAENLKQEIYKNLTQKKTGVHNISSTGTASLDFSFMNQASRNQWLGMYNRGSISTSGYISYLQSQAAWERSMAATNMLASATNFMIAAEDIASKLIEEVQRQRYMEMFPFRLASIIQAQRNGIYGPYCVRPFIRESGLAGVQGAGRWGFLLVDMRTGAWGEVTTSPDEYFSRLNTLNLIPVLFTTEGDMLITRGTGLKTDKFQLRIGWGDVPTNNPGLNLIAYRLKDIPLKSANQYHKDKKLIFGKPISGESALTFIRAGMTTMDKMKAHFGEPFEHYLGEIYGDPWAKWLYVREFKGIITHDGVHCDLNKKGVVTKVKRNCWPFDYSTRKCLTVDEYIEEFDK